MHQRIRLSTSALICLFSIFLIGAGISRYLETDSGDILIHDIDVESYEGFFYGARLFRPLQASSMNQRPSVLLIPGAIANRYTCDHIAMELARRGFVALTMEDFSQGMTSPEPDFETENLVDAGYTYLATRSFTDHARIGVAAFYSGAEKVLAAESYPLFAAKLFISPTLSNGERIPDEAIIFQSSLNHNSEPPSADSAEDRIKTFAASNAGMLVNRNAIAGMLTYFHEALAIPNDSPFWFDSASQHAQMLVWLRGILLMLLMVICIGFSARLTDGNGKTVPRTITRVIVPLLLFLAVSEIMNFFIISVRLGAPFHYLPRLSQLRRNFNLWECTGLLILSLIWSIPVRKNSWPGYLADCFALFGLGFVLFGILPELLGSRSGWDLLGITRYRWAVGLVTFYACITSVLLRIPDSRKRSRIPAAAVTGIMIYIICSGLPAAILN